MRISAPKQLLKENFDKQYHDLVDQIAFSYNSFTEQVYNVLNKNVDIDNVVDSYVTITVENGSGDLKMPVDIKNTVKTRLQGISCIQAVNLTNPAVYPTTAPFIVYTINTNGLIKVQKVLGIPDNNKFSLTLRLHG